MSEKLRRIAVISGSRIPFCRSNSVYFEKSNMDLLSASLQGLAARFDLHGVKIDELTAGAVTTHPKDWNLAREALQSTSLSPLTPGTTMQQACATSLQGALLLGGKIATGEIECGIAAGSDTTSDFPVTFGHKFSRRLARAAAARSFKQRLAAFKGFGPSEHKPDVPAPGEPRTGLSMAQHCDRMAREWGVSRADQDQLAMESHHKAARAWDEGFFDETVTPWGGVSRDNNIRADSSLEKLGSLRTVFSTGGEATMTAGNSTPLTDGAAAVLLASEDWAKERGLPVQAYITAGRTAAVDYVNDEGLLMAPTVAVAEMLQRTGLSLQDFDFYEIHEAFAAQVLATLAAWESEDYCRDRLGLDAALGSIDRDKMNVKGGSVAIGHPFAATGARIIGSLAQLLENEGGGRGVIAGGTAGGRGGAASGERPGG